MYFGAWYKFNVNLVIKNNEKTPNKDRMLVGTLAGEGVCVCARYWLNHGVHIMYKYSMDVLMINTSVGEGVRIWYALGIPLEHRY